MKFISRIGAFAFGLWATTIFSSLLAQSQSSATPAEVIIHESSRIPSIQSARLSSEDWIPESAKTANQTLLLPFFDDFAYESLFPDTNRWQFDSIRFPYISRDLAISPPTLGCVVLDGANRRGSYYSLPGPNPPYPEGNADQLTSLPIDLSLYMPGDNVRLSFVYQPRGLGNEPEISDSLMVFFRDTTSNFVRFVKVWSIPGSELHPFRAVSIPVDNERFLHGNFQFSIRNKATLTGQLDHWLIDYVYLDGNRTEADTLFDDQAIEIPTPSLFFPYTRISLPQYADEYWNRFRNFGISIRNLGTNPSNRTLVTNISEIKHNTLLTGNVSYNLAFNLNPGPQVRAFNAFDPQPFQDYMLLRHTTLLDLPDSRPVNDSCRVDYPIDSIMAYDDGTPEAAYGLNTARTFLQRYELYTPDSISTVQMCFIKTLYNVDIPKSFVLTIYDGDETPGNILYEQFSAALIPDSLNQFHSIALDSMLAVGRSFWVGIRQTDPEPIGIGLDFNHANTRMVWDSLQTWVKSNVSATMMVRLVLSKGTTIPAHTFTDTQESTFFTVYPNPIADYTLNWFRSDIGPAIFTLYDLQGKAQWEWPTQEAQGTTILPASISSGIYVLECRNTITNETGRMRVYLP